MRFLTAVLFALLVSTGTAMADYVLQAESRDLQADPPETDHMVLYLGKDKLATENAPGTGDASKSIYDATEKVIWHVESASKSYMRIDEASMRQIGSQMDAAMQQMREQMEKMPEEERQHMEQMMKGVMGGEVKKTTWTVEETSEKQDILGRSCKRYDVFANGVKQSEIWAAGWKEAGVPKESFDILRNFASFMEQIASSVPAFAKAMQEQGGVMPGLEKIDGFPVRVVDFEGSEPTQETTFTSVEQKKIDASFYKVPADYTEKKLGE
jgi:hypothetical protein